MAASNDDFSPKQLELLATIVPNASRIGLLGNGASPNYLPILKNAQDAVRQTGLLLILKQANKAEEIENAFAEFKKEGAEAVMVASEALFFSQRVQLADLTLRYRLPTMFTQPEHADAGGLMSYGQSEKDVYRIAAVFVHKLMHGAKPADLPVEQPTRFHFVINRKTADALGITIPPILYIFADKVIE